MSHDSITRILAGVLIPLKYDSKELERPLASVVISVLQMMTGPRKVLDGYVKFQEVV